MEEERSRAFLPDDFALGLTYDDYALMGLVSAMFSQLDLVWSFLVWSLIAECDVITTHCSDPATKLQKVGAAVTATLSSRRKVDLAVALATERFGVKDSRVADVQSLANKFTPLEDQKHYDPLLVVADWYACQGSGPWAHMAHQAQSQAQAGSCGFERYWHRQSRSPQIGDTDARLGRGSALSAHVDVSEMMTPSPPSRRMQLAAASLLRNVG
jgi:hypothetical protein